MLAQKSYPQYDSGREYDEDCRNAVNMYMGIDGFVPLKVGSLMIMSNNV